MKGHFIDMKTGISYKRYSDYYLPDVSLPPQKEVQLNRFGRALCAISKSIGVVLITTCSCHANYMSISVRLVQNLHTHRYHN